MAADDTADMVSKALRRADEFDLMLSTLRYVMGAGQAANGETARDHYNAIINSIANRAERTEAADVRLACESVKRAALAAAPPAQPNAEPVATLHDDGYWTHKPSRDPLDQFSGKSRLDVYAAPVAEQPTPLQHKGLTVQAGADGVWLNFAASTGRHALLNVDRIADSHGGIVSKALRDWAADVAKATGEAL